VRKWGERNNNNKREELRKKWITISRVYVVGGGSKKLATDLVSRNGSQPE